MVHESDIDFPATLVVALHQLADEIGVHNPRLDDEGGSPSAATPGRRRRPVLTLLGLDGRRWPARRTLCLDSLRRIFERLLAAA